MAMPGYVKLTKLTVRELVLSDYWVVNSAVGYLKKKMGQTCPLSFVKTQLSKQLHSSRLVLRANLKEAVLSGEKRMRTIDM